MDDFSIDESEAIAYLNSNEGQAFREAFEAGWQAGQAELKKEYREFLNGLGRDLMSMLDKVQVFRVRALKQI